jgi:hypothetical protein
MIKLISNNGISLEVLQSDDIRRYHVDDVYLHQLGDQYVHLCGINRYTLLNFAGYDSNKIDMAYPQEWRDNNPEVDQRFKGGDRAMWSYEKPHHIFGKALWLSEVWNKINEIISEKIKLGEYEYEK